MPKPPLRWIAGGVGAFLVGVLLHLGTGATYAAFSDSRTLPDNTITAGVWDAAPASSRTCDDTTGRSPAHRQATRDTDDAPAPHDGNCPDSSAGTGCRGGDASADCEAPGP